MRPVIEKGKPLATLYIRSGFAARLAASRAGVTGATRGRTWTMADPKHAASDAARALLDDFSLEMTGKDVPALEDAAAAIPPGTHINVTFLGNEDLPMRVSAAAAVK